MPTLEEVEVAFSQWRATKTRKHEPVPENLIKMARDLVAEHGVVTVSKRLRVAHRKLSPKKEFSTKFIEVARETGEHCPQIVTLNLKLLKREITVTLPAGDLTAISELLKRLSRL